MVPTVGSSGLPVESHRYKEAQPIEVGCIAPAFVLPDADMTAFDLNDATTRFIVVLCFYPRDGTPACTRQAIDFSDHDQDFAREGSIVVGVSPDDCLTHAAFIDEHGLSIRLLSDESAEVCRLYGVLQTRESDGRVCVRRSTFVIDRNCRIRHAFRDINARGHTAEVLEQIRKIARNPHGNHQELGRHT